MSEKPIKPIKLIIWDLDGTLIHFKINSVKAIKRLWDTKGKPFY
jgi:beta-phosphoglucomutase-like phosphatase (HAD superfamily)